MPYETLPEEAVRAIDHPPLGYSSSPVKFSTIYQYCPPKSPVFKMKSVAIPGVTKLIEDRFQELAGEWQEAVAPFSSIRRKLDHPLYREIVALGEPAIQLILKSIKTKPSHLVWALAEITGEDPADRTTAKNILDVIDAWIAWGREKGYEV